MISRRVALVGAGMMVAAVVTWLLFIGLPGWYGRRDTKAATAAVSGTPAPAGRKIKARLFYVSDDGGRLTSVEREVGFGEDTGAQARQIIEAQIAPVAGPLVSAIPAGTKLRAVFVTEHGEAFLDFTRELVSLHSGGSTDELLTVYTLVNAVAVNLPAIHAVQLLVDGMQVDTLGGHIDLRRPIEKDLSWIQ